MVIYYSNIMFLLPSLLLTFLLLVLLLSYQDFLFPLSLKSNYKPQYIPVTQHPPLFPPIKRLSFHGPVTTFTNSGINTVDKCTQLNMPPDNVSRHLPSVDPRPKLPQTPVYTGNQPHTSAKKAPRYIDQYNLEC